MAIIPTVTGGEAFAQMLKEGLEGLGTHRAFIALSEQTAYCEQRPPSAPCGWIKKAVAELSHTI